MLRSAGWTTLEQFLCSWLCHKIKQLLFNTFYPSFITCKQLVNKPVARLLNLYYLDDTDRLSREVVGGVEDKRKEEGEEPVPNQKEQVHEINQIYKWMKRRFTSQKSIKGEIWRCL